ncbi:MAG: TetR/AcrR family transcriptional regulator [Deltaproteobacteria bacterium]|nr:TetR/AcrR family transcriptional regulator [Deltaproteobacteria bacterium]
MHEGEKAVVRARREPATTDGRVLRGARNHEAIARAMYDLVRATHLPPSIEEVARRARVGIRTVFRQFEDLDSLYRSLNDRLQREIMTMVSLTAPSGDLEVDLRALVARRARVFEHITPFRRAGRLVRHQSRFLQEQDAMMARFFRAALEAHVASRVGGDALEALDALLSFEVWDRLRDAQKLGAKRAERVLSEAALTIARSGR